MDMTPGRLLFVSRIAQEEDRRELDSMAIATRVGGADKKGFNDFFKKR